MHLITSFTWENAISSGIICLKVKVSALTSLGTGFIPVYLYWLKMKGSRFLTDTILLIHSYIHEYIHMFIHTCMNVHIHTHTHVYNLFINGDH